MRIILLTAILFLCAPALTAQSSRKSENYFETVVLKPGHQNKVAISDGINFNRERFAVVISSVKSELLFEPVKLKLSSITPFLAVTGGWNDAEQNTNVYIRFSENGIKWDNWKLLKKDEHSEGAQYEQVSQLLFEDKKYTFYQLRIETNLLGKGEIVADLLFNFFSPGDEVTPAAATPPPPPQLFTDDATACTCALPSFITRAGWNCPQAPWSPSTTAVTHLIVHHSAGANTSSDWGAVVLSIWNAHRNPPNNYSDIGYNWLIAPNGVLYEGRYLSPTNDIQGAHFCGTNGNTMGVCMMGTYTSQTITPEARNTLIKVLAWKACQLNIDVTGISLHANSGLTINHISGHRQGCATECPGTLLYNDLPGIRTAVKAYQDNGCTLTPVINIEGLEEFSISPNPTNKNLLLKLKLNTAKEVYYRIINAEGKLIFTSAKQKLSGVTVTEITSLQNQPAGNYILQVWLNGQTVSKHVVKQ
jgi:hypothetical protein